MKVARMLGKELWKEWKRDRIGRHAAAISYYTIFSLPAFLLIVISIAGATLDPDTVNAELFGTLRLYLGDRTTDVLEQALENIQLHSVESVWMGYIGAIILILAAARIIRELQTSLNTIVNEKPTPIKTSRRILNYFLAFFLLIVAAVILVAAIISGTIIGVMNERVEELFSIPIDVLSIANGAITYVTVTLMIFALYVFLPAKRFRVLIAFLCAVIAGSILVTGTVVASYYIAKAGIGRAYGIAASVLILLFWIYFAANVFLFGAQLMEVSQRLQQKARWARTLDPRRILRLK